MSIGATILPEFDHEMSSTRRVLEQIPDDKLDWRAHPKSNTIGWVASHLVDIVSWVEGTLTQDEWEIHPVGGELYSTPNLTSRTEILDTFDKNIGVARQQIEDTSDQDYGKDWSLLVQGKTIMTLPKIGVIRTWVLNHSIHHRAHLCVYLRLNDLPVPGMYGPSADDAG